MLLVSYDPSSYPNWLDIRSPVTERPRETRLHLSLPHNQSCPVNLIGSLSRPRIWSSVVWCLLKSFSFVEDMEMDKRLYLHVGWPAGFPGPHIVRLSRQFKDKSREITLSLQHTPPCEVHLMQQVVVRFHYDADDTYLGMKITYLTYLLWSFRVEELKFIVQFH